jgi:integrase/recombinase XerD
MTRRPRGRPKGSGGPVTVLTSDQVRDVLRAAVNSGRYSDRAQLAFLMSIELGLTAGQLAAMRVGDVVDVAGQLLESLSNAQPELRRALANYCEQHVNPHAQQARLFRSQRGGALRPFSLASMLTSIYKCAGIRGASSRSGRKTALLTHSGRVSLRSEGIR